MVDTGELESYLNGRTAKDGDVITVIGEGGFDTIKKDGQLDKKVLNIPVSNGNRELTYTPGKKALTILQEAWGLDTKDWVNKKFNVKLVLMQIGQNEINVIRPVPIETLKL